MAESQSRDGSVEGAVAEDGLINTEDLIEDGKNAKTLFCQRCPSKILRPKFGVYQEIQVYTYLFDVF